MRRERYQKLIGYEMNKNILLPQESNQWYKPIVTCQPILIMPSQYKFRSSQQNNKSIHRFAQQTLKQDIQSATSVKHEWPQSCMGLILCEHHQNDQTFYVYGTGTLIRNKIVLTSAQNVYCRRLYTEYVNIRFITGVNGNKCSGIYDVKRVHYPKEYTMQQGHENHNFAVLQLYDDLSYHCGYVGWKTFSKASDKQVIEYGYTSDNNEGSFKLQEIRKQIKLQQHDKGFSGIGGGVLIKRNEDQDECYVVGLRMRSQLIQYCVLSQNMRKIVNQWTQQTILDLYSRKIDAQGCKYLSQVNLLHLNTINLYNNRISTQGCSYLSQSKWPHLTKIYLSKNEIGDQGCKYLSKANWPQLAIICLISNNIGDQGCMYISEVNWTNLTNIQLSNNKITAQGCKYLRKANWKKLIIIDLNSNNIGPQGCKYLSQANWPSLSTISLYSNKIQSQGCKYLSRANWRYLTYIYIQNNNIALGCRYLSQTNWEYLNMINLNNNKINAQGCKYLRQSNWPNLTSIYLMQKKNTMNCIELQQLWMNATIR